MARILTVALVLALGLAISLPFHGAVASFCGDGHVDVGEECDDGNRYNSDGCSGNCVVELWWSCSNNPQTPTVCVPAERAHCFVQSQNQGEVFDNADLDGDGTVDQFAGAAAQSWADCVCGAGQVKSFVYNAAGCAQCTCNLPSVCSDSVMIGEGDDCRCLPGCAECAFSANFPTTCQRCQAGKFLADGNCVNSCPADGDFIADNASEDPTDGDYSRCVHSSVFGIPQYKAGGYVLGDFFNGEDTHLGVTFAPDAEDENLAEGSGAAIGGLSVTTMTVIAVMCFLVAIAGLAGMGYYVKKTMALPTHEKKMHLANY